MGVMLVVDSEGYVAKSVADAFAGKGGFPAAVERRTGRSAIAALREGISIDIAVIDDRLADMDGRELIVSLRKLVPELPVIMISGRHSVEAYLKAINAGAYEFVARPVSHPVLRRIINAALEDAALSRRHHPELHLKGDMMPLRPSVSSGGRS